jgi:MoaA/NifB/PqqE/SkfB family radical SAM enzyme
MGVAVNMVTNGTLVDADVARRARACGMTNVGVSLDGTEALHDALRGVGVWARATRGIGCLRDAGVPVAVMTTLNRLNMPMMGQIRQMAMDLGASLWRLQLGKPMGAMRDRDDLVLRPRDIATLIPTLARMKREGGIALAVGDSIGYYGPHDRVLRGWGWRGRRERWQGCQAGLQAIGIESDGGIKGCLSLQARCGDEDPFREGSVRDASLAELWARKGMFAYNREFTVDQLTGRCRSCDKAGDCRGGARCVAAAATGGVGEDPYCWLAVAPPDARPGGRAMMAAGVAAAMVVGSAGCIDPEPVDQADITDDPGSGVVDVRDRDLIGVPDSDIHYWDPGPVSDPGIDIDVPSDAGDADLDVLPSDPGPGDAIDCTNVCCLCEYGIIPDEIAAACCGVDAHVSDPGPSDEGLSDPGPGGDAMECADVCCMCDYGVIPEDVYQECCVEACKDVCCECDYGTPPPPQCC